MNRKRFLQIITLMELAAATAVILLDLLIPTLVVLAMLALSLVLRREGFSTLGFKKLSLRLCITSFLLAVLWTAVDFGLLLPLLNRLTGASRDMTAFESLKGNLGQLLILLTLGWTLAALGEEIVYRGYIPNRIRAIAGNQAAGKALALLVSCALFGLAHREQGITGIIITMLDALFFSYVVAKNGGNLWTSVLVHGFMNSFGFIVFFFTGPLYGLW